MWKNKNCKKMSKNDKNVKLFSKKCLKKIEKMFKKSSKNYDWKNGQKNLEKIWKIIVRK